MSIVARPAAAPTIAGRPAQPIRVMISSRCNDAFAGKPLRSYRDHLHAARLQGLEAVFFSPTGDPSERNRISQKHVDFLFCDPQTLKPMLGDDRFASWSAAAMPDGLNYPNANPTISFTRLFAGSTQSGNAKLVCNAGLLIGVVMSSSKQ